MAPNGPTRLSCSGTLRRRARSHGLSWLAWLVALPVALGTACRASSPDGVVAPVASARSPLRRTQPLASAATGQAAPLLGRVEAMRSDGSAAIVEGWACRHGLPASVDVQVHAGAPAVFVDGSGLGGVLLPTTVKRLASSKAILATCGAGSAGAFNFELSIPAAVRSQYQGLRLYVHEKPQGAAASATPLEDPHASAIPLDRAVQSLLLPGVPRVLVTPTVLETLRASKTLASSKPWQRLLQIARDLPSTPRPFAGRSCPELIESIERDLAQLPYVALACRVTDDGAQCQKAKTILLGWANATIPSCQPDIERGLTVGRYLGQIAEGYALLAVDMTEPERASVRAFFAAMGRQIRGASLRWNEDLGVEGPNNHLQWHNYGMAVAGLVSRDFDLVGYALANSANSQTYAGASRPRHFLGMVQDSIFEAGSAHNVFRSEGYDHGDAVLATGEIWDRYRHNPSFHGLAYSLFALSAMTYTGHLAALNGLTYAGVPLMASGDARSAVPTPSILNALNFYSKLMLDAVRCERGGELGYLPYRGERACSGDASVGGFMVGAAYLTGDARTQVMDAANICRASRTSTSPDDDAYVADTYLTNGFPQLYLLIITGQYAAPPPQLACHR